MMNLPNKSIDKRIETLEELCNFSEIKVTHRVHNNEHVFEFWLGEKTLNTIFTYRKARTFAYGIRIGKFLLEKGTK